MPDSDDRNEAHLVLRAIHSRLGEQDAQVVGTLALNEHELSVADGNVRLRAIVLHDPEWHPSIAHCHVVADFGRGELAVPLEACVVGVDDDRKRALANVAQSWVAAVAGPIFSLLRAREVMGATHFDGSERWGVAGCHGFAGPLIGRMIPDGFDLSVLSEAPTFDSVAEMAPPGVLHLAKVTLRPGEGGRWVRSIELDGHAAAHEEQGWDAPVPAPANGVISQFALFHFGGQVAAVDERRRTDDAIRRFVSIFGRTGDTVSAERELLESGAADVVLAHDVAQFVPLALGRIIFGAMGPTFSPEFVRVMSNGQTVTGLRLMRQPVFARTLSAIGHEMLAGEHREAARRLALSGPEFNAINNALNAGVTLENSKLLPTVVPDPDASADAIERAMARHLKAPGAPPPPPAQSSATPRASKPWWRFW